jgi:hypothetical protein
VQSFDPETVQVHKDEQGKLKIQAAVNWPFNAGFQYEEEYRHFFEWAKHLNNCHPDITDETFGPKNYHILRFQTKPYDELVSRLNIFIQEACQFIKDCYRLRQSPERFKPKELFFAVGSSQAQEETETKLHSFEIENERIRCSDVSELQALIPYLKRSLQLFAQIKEKTKSALSSGETRSNIYQLQTRSYLEQISQSTLQFKLDELSLTEFLRSHQIGVLQYRWLMGKSGQG